MDFWTLDGRWPDSLQKGFIKFIDAQVRLQICTEQSAIPAGSPKDKPQHILYDDEVIMQEISSLFKAAFDKDLLIDFRGGSVIPIHVGSIDPSTARSDRVSNAYVKAIRAFPRLVDQGDGMKSYAGILFEAVVSQRDITLLDEPEAFLHPPQMRRLGKVLSKRVDGQLFIATHSSDVLRGIMEGDNAKITILRISRVEGEVRIHKATSESLNAFW